MAKLNEEYQECAFCHKSQTKHICVKCGKPVCYACDAQSATSKSENRRCPDHPARRKVQV